MPPISSKFDIMLDYPIMAVITGFRKIDNWEACASRHDAAFNKKLIAKFSRQLIRAECFNETTINACCCKSILPPLNQKITISQTCDFFLQALEFEFFNRIPKMRQKDQGYLHRHHIVTTTNLVCPVLAMLVAAESGV
jgi:hypothetical protein